MKIPLTIFFILGTISLIYYLYYLRVSYFDGSWVAAPIFLERTGISNIACDFKGGNLTCVLMNDGAIDVQKFKFYVNPMTSTITITPKSESDKVFDGEYNYDYYRDMQRVAFMKDEKIAMDLILTDETSSESD